MIHIQNKKLYTAAEILELDLLPAKDLRSTTRFLIEDKAKKKPVLDAQIRGEGRMRRYYVIGKNLSRYARSIT